MTADPQLPPTVLRAVERALGTTIDTVEEIRGGGGFTPAVRRRVAASDGRTFFLKVAVGELTAEWLRIEQNVYRHASGTFMPELAACSDGTDDDEGEHPWMLLEDLGEAGWPPPWESSDITAVRAALDEVHAAPAPPGIERLPEISPVTAGWRRRRGPRAAADTGHVRRRLAGAAPGRPPRCVPARAGPRRLPPSPRRPQRQRLHHLTVAHCWSTGTGRPWATPASMRHSGCRACRWRPAGPRGTVDSARTPRHRRRVLRLLRRPAGDPDPPRSGSSNGPTRRGAAVGRPCPRPSRPGRGQPHRRRVIRARTATGRAPAFRRARPVGFCAPSGDTCAAGGHSA